MNDKETSEIAKKVFNQMIERREQRHKEFDRGLRHFVNWMILFILFSTIIVFLGMAGIGLLLIIGNIWVSYSLVAAVAIMLGITVSDYFDFNKKEIDEVEKNE